MKSVDVLLDGQSLVTPRSIAAEILSIKDNSVNEHDKLTAESELAIILNLAGQQIEKKMEPDQIHGMLGANLHALRAKSAPAIWQHLIGLAQNHSIANYFLQDPFTRWSFVKPRGYSGDAQLIDFIYGHPSLNDEIAKSTPTGLALYEVNRNSSASIAVRERRDLLTKHVDEIAGSRGRDTEILTIAAGHLREANRSVALQQQGIKRWVALDQDPMSIGSIRRDFANTCIEAVDGSVRSLLTNAHDLGTFDFVYAAGLYDYLNDKVSIKLTRKCLQMLKPNGVFMFANFSEDIIADGYMETFMNWALLLRTEEDMWRIMRSSTVDGEFDCFVRFGENRNIVYGFMRKVA
ncbi:class I SAM-dependent methyltransferase [Rhizobium oryziradicis]|uniref:Methyltransferase n=1 Tax=Rhizobium oryziradicis TaxID=1867956 RepID=A0A1Q8ZN31_9HYPH|nr:class I SAM-dependent methyltransferase [Rhizobium oryziradicis]OLP43176.1 methyltransferase [Rhizobium oryziradicis]